MVATYSAERAPRCCGERLTFGIPTCDCIICGKQYPFNEIAEFFYTVVLPTLPFEVGINVKRRINQLYMKR